MKNFGTVVDEIYEFFDEILGSLIPGIYFCSYLLLVISVFINYCDKDNMLPNIPYITIFILVISYVIGTMFRRSNSREPDLKSAKFIYFNSVPCDDNDFAFNKLVTDADFDNLIKDIKKRKNNHEINIDYNEQKVFKRKRKLNFYEKLFYDSHKKEKDRFKLYSKPYIQNYIYNKLLNRLDNLDTDLVSNQNEINCINEFIIKHKLDKYCKISIDYPYANLKNYLRDRGMNNLVKYVKWDYVENSSTTQRSKSVICNMKLYIRHKSPKDYGELLKTEAHIRFMNSIWYANKFLSNISSLMLAICASASIFIFIVLDNNLLRIIYNNEHLSALTIALKYIVSSCKNIFRYIFGDSFEIKNLLTALIFIFFISLFYFIFGKIIRRTIENNFHYQRIREVVSVLTVYDMLKKEEIIKQNQKKRTFKVKISK